jgi:pilus assembly protein CpaB
MSARQLIVLVVAAFAAIGALLLIRGMGARSAAPTAAEAEQIAGEQVLVAARDIGQGAALQPGDLAVALFPSASVAPTFVKLSAQPSAQADFVGAVTRRTFAQGEPITAGAVVQSNDRSFLAAQLEPGYRAISIEINRETSAGGYIQPNDRVDVIVTSHVDGEGGGGQEVRSDIVLEDIRVLAIGDATQQQTTGDHPTTVEGGVAVLEMTQEDARTLALADELGTINLALRGVQVETVGMRNPNGSAGNLTQGSGAVRIHSFGTVSGGGR